MDKAKIIAVKTEMAEHDWTTFVDDPPAQRVWSVQESVEEWVFAKRLCSALSAGENLNDHCIILRRADPAFLV
jgi:hypothetical protein